MGLLVPDSRGAWVDGRQVSADALEIDRRLREGDPTAGWPGDSRLVLTWDAPRDRWIVVRHCEDGVDRGLAFWEAGELGMIPSCLAQMRLDRPDRVGVEERIDKANAQKEEIVWAEWRDVYGEMAEHMAKLVHDTTEPRTVFRQVGGRRDAGH